jgi:ATP-dependent RNA helicase DDX31/DBP7
MADDGMLVNFSHASATIAPQTKFKGGSWKDRFLVKKAAKYRAQKRTSTASVSSQRSPAQHQKSSTSSTEDGDFAIDRPNKRRKKHGDFVTTTAQNGYTSDNKNNGRHHQSKGPREVVSSLFSYNPKPSNPFEEPSSASEVPATPTNAPLPDGIDTFTSLGLSAPLAAHLMTKMSLKTPTAIQKSSVSQLVKEDSDAFIQSETGSGKTLAYLLPIVQRIMTLTGTDGFNNVHRDSGLFAIILAPTRELCKQILVVLERLLGCAHWIVAGNVIGGEKKKSEKARLRKGLNILVATPGRLVDHLENTRVLDVSSVRWLVLDEGDRLMDLGFDEDISKIVKTLDQRQEHGTTPGLPERRTTVLCSATMKMTVQRLGEISLKDAVLIRSEENDSTSTDAAQESTVSQDFLAPAQLKQSYAIVASKLRVVTLVALLKRTFARKGSVMKAIVFVSCADSVEFHFRALTRSSENGDEVDDPSSDAERTDKKKAAVHHDSIGPSSLLSSPANLLTVFKLHGSLAQPVRTSIVRAFASATTPSLLIATDVASRGLDLTNLDLVIEYDPPFSAEDHLHRIGRTARLGRDGRAIIFLLPGAEEGYVDVLKSSYKTNVESTKAVTQMDANDILKKGFTSVGGGSAPKNRELKDWEREATEFQLDMERWIVESAPDHELAQKAFQSHVRAYATHVAAERKWFDIKSLHLGHLAKAFGLRDTPGRMNVPGMGNRGAASDGSKRRRQSGQNGKNNDKTVARNETTAETEEAARKMKEKVRNKKMMSGAGADEFNIA